MHNSFRSLTDVGFLLNATEAAYTVSCYINYIILALDNLYYVLVIMLAISGHNMP